MTIYTEEDFKDKDWIVRLSAYEALGFTEDAFKDKDWRVRLRAYEYFKRCCDILELGNSKRTKFTEDEKELLRFNGIPVL